MYRLRKEQGLNKLETLPADTHLLQLSFILTLLNLHYGANELYLYNKSTTTFGVFVSAFFKAMAV